MSRLLRALGALSLGTALAVTGALPASAAATVTPPSAPVPNYDDGLFGSPDVFSAAYKQALALLAISTLDDAQVTDEDQTAVDAGLDWLVAQQCPDGGWQGYKLEGVDCGPLSTDVNDPSGLAFVNEDSNTTAAVVQAFAAFGVEDDPVPSALTFLKTLQNADGGFELSKGLGSDPNSTALVIQAFIAVGEDPTTLPKGNPFAYLQSLQLNCADLNPDPTQDPQQGDIGGIQAPFAPHSANTLATVQSTSALAGVPYPVPPASEQASGGADLGCVNNQLLSPHHVTKTTRTTATTTVKAQPAATATAAPTETAAPSSEASPSATASPVDTAAPSESAASEAPGGAPSQAPTAASSGAPTAAPTPAPAPAGAPAKAAPRIHKPAPATKVKPAFVATTPGQAADAAASWAAQRLTASGYLDSGFGPDWASTAYAVMGFAATSSNSTAMNKALAYFQSHLAAATTKNGEDEVGGLSLAALAAFAGGLDPTDFANSDLITRIEALQYFTPETPVVEPPVEVPVAQPGGGVAGSAGGGLPFTGFRTDTFGQLALLMVLLGAALVGSTHLRAPIRGRHAA